MFKKILMLTFIFTSASFSFQGTDYERLLKQIEVGYNKNLVLFISSDNCKYCAKLKKVIEEDTDVRTAIYYKFSNYFEINKDQINLPESLYVPVTPAILIVSPKGDILLKSFGYKDNVELLEILEEYAIENKDHISFYENNSTTPIVIDAEINELNVSNIKISKYNLEQILVSS